MLLERVVARAHRLSGDLLQRVAMTNVPPSRRAQVTEALYAPQRSYAPGGARFGEGLFDWERRVIDHVAWPRRGRLLVGGAGGGREVVALAARGYRVTGFDPAEALVEMGRAAVARCGGCSLVPGGYDDLVAESRGARTRLRGALSDGPFDGVILGWGSLNHVLELEDRADLVASIRRLWPSAPLLLTYYRDGEGAEGTPEQPVRFAPHAGYYRTMTDRELADLARAGGYDIALASAEPYPHALLVPSADLAGTGARAPA